MEKPQVAIILPVYNVMPHIKYMITELYKSTNFPFKLIIVDGFSDDGTKEYLDEIEQSRHNVEVYQIPKKGLTNAINYGIKKAGKLDVYLTQADVIHFRLYGRDWLLEMYTAAQKKTAGMIIGHCGGGLSGPDYIEGLRWAGTWNTYIPRHTIDKIGLFDENMGPGDDIDYSYRVGKAKLQGVICDFWVQHHRMTDHLDADETEKQDKMAKYFRKKWGIK